VARGNPRRAAGAAAREAATLCARVRNYALRRGGLRARRSGRIIFEAVAKAGGSAKSAANWMQTELLRRLNDSGKDMMLARFSRGACGAAEAGRRRKDYWRGG